MADRVSFHTDFDRDIAEAAAWYEGRVGGLGRAFVRLVQETLAEVTADPTRFSRFDRLGRYAPVERFPYVVLFEVSEDELFFAGVMHTARDREKWRSRLG